MHTMRIEYTLGLSSRNLNYYTVFGSIPDLIDSIEPGLGVYASCYILNVRAKPDDIALTDRYYTLEVL